MEQDMSCINATDLTKMSTQEALSLLNKEKQQLHKQKNKTQDWCLPIEVLAHLDPTDILEHIL